MDFFSLIENSLLGGIKFWGVDNMLSAKENAKHVRERDRQISNLSHNILNMSPI